MTKTQQLKIEQYIQAALKAHLQMETKQLKAQKLSKEIILNLQYCLIYLEEQENICAMSKTV